MDKEFLLRLENTLKQIKKDLILNENIRKLLFYDVNYLKAQAEDGVEYADLPVPAVELVKDNIFLQPIVEIDNQPPFDKKTFISITSPSMGFHAKNEVEYAIKISVQIDKTNWVYNNQIKVYELAQEIINTLEGKKYDCATELMFEQMLETVTDKTVTGKSLLFSLTDGVGEDE